MTIRCLSHLPMYNVWLWVILMHLKSVQKYILFPYNKSQYTVKVEDWSRNAGKIIIFSNFPLNSNYIWFFSRNSQKNNKIIILSFIEFCVVFLYGIRKTKKNQTNKTYFKDKWSLLSTVSFDQWEHYVSSPYFLYIMGILTKVTFLCWLLIERIVHHTFRIIVGWK